MAVHPFGLLEGVVAAMNAGLAALKQDGKRVGALSSAELQELPRLSPVRRQAARFAWTRPKHRIPQSLADDFVATQKQGTLSAQVEGGFPQMTLLPFIRTGDAISSIASRPIRRSRR